MDNYRLSFNITHNGRHVFMISLHFNRTVGDLKVAIENEARSIGPEMDSIRLPFTLLIGGQCPPDDLPLHKTYSFEQTAISIITNVAQVSDSSNSPSKYSNTSHFIFHDIPEPPSFWGICAPEKQVLPAKLNTICTFCNNDSNCCNIPKNWKDIEFVNDFDGYCTHCRNYTKLQYIFTCPGNDQKFLASSASGTMSILHNFIANPSGKLQCDIMLEVIAKPYAIQSYPCGHIIDTETLEDYLRMGQTDGLYKYLIQNTNSETNDRISYLIVCPVCKFDNQKPRADKGTMTLGTLRIFPSYYDSIKVLAEQNAIRKGEIIYCKNTYNHPSGRKFFLPIVPLPQDTSKCKCPECNLEICRYHGTLWPNCSCARASAEQTDEWLNQELNNISEWIYCTVCPICETKRKGLYELCTNLRCDCCSNVYCYLCGIVLENYDPYKLHQHNEHKNKFGCPKELTNLPMFENYSSSGAWEWFYDLRTYKLLLELRDNVKDKEQFNRVLSHHPQFANKAGKLDKQKKFFSHDARWQKIFSYDPSIIKW